MFTIVNFLIFEVTFVNTKVTTVVFIDVYFYLILVSNFYLCLFIYREFE